MSSPVILPLDFLVLRHLERFSGSQILLSSESLATTSDIDSVVSELVVVEVVVRPAESLQQAKRSLVAVSLTRAEKLETDFPFDRLA